MIPTAIVAYLALFAAVGFCFALAALLVGWFVRAREPNSRKAEIYECGEPSIGPGSVQFDLRFYVVALLFLIFEVEVAFFFPPATIFGEANQFRASHQQAAAVEGDTTAVEKTDAKAVEKEAMSLSSAHVLALTSMLDLGVFFAVLLVGFVYLWRRGDLDWVRAVRHPRAALENTTMIRLRGSDQS